MGPKRNLSPEQETEIAERYSKGESARFIWQDFSHVSYQTVLNTLKRKDVPQSPEFDKSRLPVETRNLIALACVNGSTVPTVAERFGTSEKTVFRILKQHGISLPAGRPKTSR